MANTIKTKTGRIQYYNVMYSAGREYPRLVGGQYPTREAARAELDEARASKLISRAWLEGFEKDEHGNVSRIF